MNPKSLITNHKSYLKVNTVTWLALGLIVMLAPVVYFTLRAPGKAEAVWFNDAWSFRKKITIDADQVSGSTDFSSFPVMITISNDTNISAGAQDDGDDIVFADLAGSRLDHEIESYAEDGSGADLVAWVRIPTLSATQDTDVYMYYGNSTVTAQEQPAKVWDTGFALVQHLQETSGTHYDSTGFVNNSDVVSVTNQGTTAGVANGTDEFDGANDYVHIPDNTQLEIPNDITISFWMNLDQQATTKGETLTIIRKAHNTSPFNGYYVTQENGTNEILFGWRNTGDTGYIAKNNTSISTGTWYYVTAVKSGSTTTIYINGSTASTYQTGSTTGTNKDTDGGLYIGANTSSSERVDGKLDEVRISKVARSSDWIVTEYNNMNAPGTFFSMDSQEVTSGPIGYWKLDEGADNTCSGGSNDVCDSSGKGKDLSKSVATWQAENMCISGKCLYFSGANDYLSRLHDSDFDFSGTDSFTIQAWFRHAPISTSADTIISMLESSGTDGGFNLNMQLTGTIQLNIDDDDADTNVETLTTPAAYDDNRWHFVSAVRDGTNSHKIYIDGVLVAQDLTVNETSSLANDDTLYVGNLEGLGNDWVGFLDEVKIYRYARSAEEIKADYAGGAQVLGKSTKSGDFLSDGLVGYWKMDETAINSCTGGSNDACDSSGNALNGAFEASMTNANFTQGKFGNSVSFDGTDDHIIWSDNAAFSPNTISVAMWFKPASLGSVGGDQTLIEHDHSQAPWAGFQMGYSSSDLLECYVRNQAGDGTYLYAEGIDTTTNWYHIACTWDGKVAKLYLNGQLMNYENLTGTGTFNADGSFTLGTGDSGFGARTEGAIDDFRIYNRSLSENEVASLYNWAPGPVAYYSLDEGSGTTTVYDKSGNGLNGTLERIDPEDWVPGKYGSALNFDEPDEERINLGTPTAFNHTGAISIMAWVKVNNNTDSHRIFTKKGLSGSRGWELTYEAGTPNDARFSIADSSTTTVDVGTAGIHTAQVGTWVHVAGVYKPSEAVEIYINGVLINRNTTGVPAIQYIPTATTVYIGDRSDSDSEMDGLIDEVKYYNYARTQQQIVEDMNAGHPIGGSPIGSQLAYWSFDDQRGQTAYNRTSTSYNGTLGTDTSASTDDPTWKTKSDCKVNGCLSFDGTTDFVRADGDDASSEYSITMWMKPAAVTSRGVAEMAESPGSNIHERSLYFDSNSKLVAYNYDGAEVGARSNTTFIADTWYHVALVKDSTTVSIWVNGVREDSTTSGAPYSGYTSPEYIIGRTYNGFGAVDASITNVFYSGLLDEVKFYNSALTAEQVNIDMNAGSGQSFAVLGASEESTLSDTAGNPPTGYWNFDENTGTVAYDKSGNGLNGTLENSPEWVQGKVGSALYFRGNSDKRVAIADSDTFNVGSGSMTIQAWVKHGPNDATQDYILHNYVAGDGDGGFGLNMQATGEFRFGIDDDGASYPEDSATSVATYDDNEWHFVVGVKTGTSSIDLYVDGVWQDDDATINAINSIDSSDTLYIGTLGDGTTQEWMNGSIDEVKFYNYARTPAQILYDYNRGRPHRWYKLDECEGTTAYDSAQLNDGRPTGVNGTITAGDATGTNDSVGTCSGSVGEMWADGADGRFNSSLEFDGRNDYVSIASPGLPTEDFTYSVWFYHAANSSDTILFASDGAGGNEFKIDRPANTEVRVRVNGSTACTGGPIPSINTWNHFAVTRSGATITGFLNGTASCSGSNSTVLIFGSCPLIIGGDDSSATCDLSSVSETWAGKIDDVRIFNYAMSATQVKQMMNEGGGTRFGPSEGSP